RSAGRRASGPFPTPPPPPRPARRRGPAISRPRGPRARWCERRTRKGTGRGGRPPARLRAARPSPSCGLQLRVAPEHELEHGFDGHVLLRILEHGDTVVAGALDDVVLQSPDVLESIEVLVHG